MAKREYQAGYEPGSASYGGCRYERDRGELASGVEGARPRICTGVRIVLRELGESHDGEAYGARVPSPRSSPAMLEFLRRRIGASCASLVWVLLSAACSAQHAASVGGQPLDLPLYPGANVVLVRALTPTTGEVVASSDAMLGELDGWVRGLRQSPPAGLRVVREGAIMQLLSHLQALGVAAIVFDQRTGKARHRVMLMAFDPVQLHARFASDLGIFAHYQSLPKILRVPIDRRVHALFGVDAGQIVSPNRPVGALFAAVERLKDSQQRGILMLTLTEKSR